MAHHHTEEHTDEDEGVDMIKFTSGFCLIVGGLLCMTLVGGVIGFPMVVFGYYLYKKYDIEFEPRMKSGGNDSKAAPATMDSGEKPGNDAQ